MQYTKVGSAMPFHYAGYDRHDVQSVREKTEEANEKIDRTHRKPI